MKKLITLTILMIVVSMFSITAWAQLPPLLDRELFFGNPEMSGANLSPDGKWLMFRKPYKDTMNIYVKGVNDSFDKAKLITNETKRPIAGAFWSRDSKFILFVKDNGGDENFNVYAVNPAENPAAGAEVPIARNITDAKGVRAFIYSVPKSEADAIYVGINERDKTWHDLYKVKISTGEKTLIRKNTERITGWVFDNADQIRLATRSTEKGDTEILRVEADGKFTKIYECGIFESCSPIRFEKTNKQVYMETNKGERNFSELVLFDPATMKETFVEKDPQNRVDFGYAAFSDKTNDLVATFYEDDKTRIVFKDKGFEKDYNFVKARLGGTRELSFGSSTTDENLWIVSSFSDVDPGTVWLYNRKTKNLSTLYQVRDKLPREALAQMTPIRYKSSDGLEIPAYLTLPKGVEAKNLPLIVFPHGGPWSRDSWGYSSYAQFLANRGYAVLQMNFRGSTGYGKKFLDAGNKQWGDLMQDDITWGVKHLVSQGIADEKRVGIMGGSYGGYATLAGVAFTPDLYAAGVAIVAPSNMITLLEAIPPYWEPIRKMFYERMGNPNTKEGLEQMKRQSPLFSADKIKTPLFVVQGANDPRVNKRESDQIVIALRDRNFPVEYMVAPDEGHGFARPVNNMAMIAKAEKFLAQYLGGRFQESMSADVAKRLGEIMVDVKTVKLPETANPNAKAEADVSGKWSLMVDAGGQIFQIDMELKQKDADFNGTISSMLGGGTVEDGKVSGKNVTANVKADIQGQTIPIKMEGVVEGDKMTGTLSGPGIPLSSFTATRK